jgi:hypothetical protein
LIGQEYKSPLKEVVGSTILGSTDFIETIKDKYLSNKKVDPNLPALKELSRGPSINEIKEEVEISSWGRQGMGQRGKDLSLPQTYRKNAKRNWPALWYWSSGVSQASRRIAMKVSQDNKLRKKIRKIENRLKL